MSMATHVARIVYAAQCAQEWGSWVIVVCPDGSASLEQSRKFLRSTSPQGGYYTGRTMQYPNKRGELSVVGDSETFGTAPDKPFSVFFVGWDGSNKNAEKRMAKWRAKATRVLSYAGIEKENLL